MHFGDKLRVPSIPRSRSFTFGHLGMLGSGSGGHLRTTRKCKSAKKCKTSEREIHLTGEEKYKTQEL